MTRQEKTIAIAGAGSIGCYAGGCLALAGCKVIFFWRGRASRMRCARMACGSATSMAATTA
ncbi:exported hypothetical protein [Mesorhizobium metallidurans STM 2683]|uniref:Ketopantoate reductase N-terminal domain-containing protein n=1 Tax=Mesorhizobium metallidurans STM 2683 TaxID=1297569 RepID=M5EIJ1_9HYPH|nr:exported hypothetical protein [Mesorhizobium metallidurans STM 2683]